MPHVFPLYDKQEPPQSPDNQCRVSSKTVITGTNIDDTLVGVLGSDTISDLGHGKTVQCYALITF